RSRLGRRRRIACAASRRGFALPSAPARAAPRAAAAAFLGASRARGRAVRGVRRLAAVAGNASGLPALAGRARILRRRRGLRAGRDRARRGAWRRRGFLLFLLRRFVLSRPSSLVAGGLVLSRLVLRAAFAALARAAVLLALAAAAALRTAVAAARRPLGSRLLLVDFLLVVGTDASVQPTEHALPDARLGARLLRRHRRRRVGQDARYRRLLDLDRPLDLLIGERGILLRLDHLVARDVVLGQLRLVVTDSLDRVVRGLEVRIADQHDLHVVALLDRVDPFALLVQQVVRDLDRQRRDDLRRALLAGFLADEAKDRERERLHAADVAGAVAARADGLRRLLERRPQPLPRELQQPEARDAADLDARTVLLHRLAQPILDLA